ncbi:MAG: hypothetical protein ABL908_16105, partial [Hyphomicrobium sp.]
GVSGLRARGIFASPALQNRGMRSSVLDHEGGCLYPNTWLVPNKYQEIDHAGYEGADHYVGGYRGCCSWGMPS